MYSFTFNGKSSRSVGITVLRRPDITSPRPIYSVIDIDGRDSTINTYDRLESYDVDMEIAVERFSDIEKVQKLLSGEGKFTGSDFDDRYVNVVFRTQIPFARIVEGLYTAVVVMTVMDPFKYALDDTITNTTDGAKEVSVENKGSTKSYPLIKIRGTGTAIIEYENNIMHFIFPTGSGPITIDTKKRKAYTATGLDRTIFLSIERDYGLSIPLEKTTIVKVGSNVTELTISKTSRWL